LQANVDKVSLLVEKPMLDSKTANLMDALINPIVTKEADECRVRIARTAAEWAVRQGISGSPAANSQLVMDYFAYHKKLAESVWTAMLRVLNETDQEAYPELATELKARFDSYLRAQEEKIRAGFVVTGPPALGNEFDRVCLEIRHKYHTEIDLFQARAEAKQRRIERIPNYASLPVTNRIHVDGIDSFHKVRNVQPDAITDLLEGGYLDRSEDSIQRALEDILTVPMHKKDWGGEQNDLFTANVVVQGFRVATAFLLKGNGLKRKTLEIRDCGHNGDQLVRLVDSPAELFVIQFVGNVAESVVRDVESKMHSLHAQGKPARYCIIDGQDTARLLRAYGKI
jgi:hypothetical protein